MVYGVLSTLSLHHSVLFVNYYLKIHLAVDLAIRCSKTIKQLAVCSDDELHLVRFMCRAGDRVVVSSRSPISVRKVTAELRDEVCLFARP